MSMLLTIFTPTYNRAWSLPRLYDSLVSQTVNDFEWIIVDDGSTDNTKDLIAAWIKEKKIDIKYFRQSNSGKMAAHNAGVRQSRGDLFLCVDSDDYLYDSEVVKYVLDNFRQLYANQEGLDKIAGIIGYRYISKKDNLPKFPESIRYTTLSDLYNKYKFYGDTALIFRTEILKLYPFPQIQGEKFITENYVYEQIDLKYSLYLFRKYLITCEYQNDGYTNNFYKHFISNPKGWRLYYLQHQKLSHAQGLDLIKSIVNYIAACRFVSKIKFKKVIEDSRWPLLTLLLYPIGVIQAYRFKQKVK